jgi:hypothetical protein
LGVIAAELTRAGRVRSAVGPPSLRAARSLTVHGAVTFGTDVQIVGDGSVTGPAILPDGRIIDS